MSGHRSMSAWFLVEGVSSSTTTVPEPRPIPVHLTTDGEYVWIEPGPETSRLGAVLTPAGWNELAVCSRRLRDEAAYAWTAMGAASP